MVNFSSQSDLESIFWVRVISSQPEEEKIKEDKKEDNIAPPMPIRVFQRAEKEGDKTWADYIWSGDDIVRIVTNQISKEQTIIEAIAVNMDCFVLKRFLSQKKINTEDELKVAKNKFFLSVYLHSLFLYSILDRINKDENCDTEIDPEDSIPLIFKPYSSFLLSASMIENITK